MCLPDAPESRKAGDKKSFAGVDDFWPGGGSSFTPRVAPSMAVFPNWSGRLDLNQRPPEPHFYGYAKLS